MALHEGYRVVAVECSADAFRAFERVYGTNEQVTMHYGCASSQTGNATLHLASDSSSLRRAAVTTRREELRKRPKGNRRKSMTVPQLVVDQLLAPFHEPVCAVKVDVQGHELSVFKGMEQTFAKHRPVLYFEHAIVNLGAEDAKELIPFIRAKGYHCFPLHCDYCNVLCTPDRQGARVYAVPAARRVQR